MTIEDALFAKLTGSPSSVADIVGERVYPNEAPQNTPGPFLVFQRITTPRVHSLTGPTGLAQPLFQFDAYAATQTEAQVLAEAVRADLDGFRGAVAGVTIRGTTSTNHADMPSETIGAKTWRRTMIEFRISHSE